MAQVEAYAINDRFGCVSVAGTSTFGKISSAVGECIVRLSVKIRF
jgi:hypothetical protein